MNFWQCFFLLSSWSYLTIS